MCVNINELSLGTGSIELRSLRQGLILEIKNKILNISLTNKVI